LGRKWVRFANSDLGQIDGEVVYFVHAREAGRDGKWVRFVNGDSGGSGGKTVGVATVGAFVEDVNAAEAGRAEVGDKMGSFCKS
jgi:hypothetical protein